MASSSVPGVLVDTLRCPVCGSTFSQTADALVCVDRGHAFPVVRHIPRLLPGAIPDAGQRRTADAFGYSWSHYPKQNPYTEQQWGDWVLPLTAADFTGKSVLDAGCGLAGFAEYARLWGADRVVGVDLSDAVDAAGERVGDRIELVQADLYALPFAPQSFDLAYSIGVLHHLPDPEKGFRAIVQTVKPGGQVFAWVYGRENNSLIVYLIDPLRRFLFSRLPRAFLKWAVALPLAVLLWPVVKAAGANLPIPYSAYFRFLSEREFAFTHGVVFDQLVAPTTHYLRRQEFEAWFERAGLIDVVITWRNENSWRGLGRVPEA